MLELFTLERLNRFGGQQRGGRQLRRSPKMSVPIVPCDCHGSENETKASRGTHGLGAVCAAFEQRACARTMSALTEYELRPAERESTASPTRSGSVAITRRGQRP
jgi:hypothetical protein